MKPNNPFLIAGYHSPEFFCDREAETSAILDALHNGRNVTLIAPRRMGKTDLIRHAFYRMKEQKPDIVTLYMDIYSTQSMGDFVRVFANTVLGKLDTAPQKALNRIGQFIRSCRPVFTIDELTGVPKVTIDVAPQEEERMTSDKTFSSPSTAADFCIGSSNNGWLVWKDKDGNTLDSVYRKQLE